MSASDRWRRLVRARFAEMERLAPGGGDLGPAFWNAGGRARRYAAAVEATGGKDPFLARLRRSVDRRSRVVDALLDPFWRHFHDRPRKPLPTYLDAAAIVLEIGGEPDIEVVEQPAMARFESLAHAVKAYRETFLLPDTPEVRAELRALLDPWLVSDDGMLRPPIKAVPAAIIPWGGSGRPSEQSMSAQPRSGRQ